MSSNYDNVNLDNPNDIFKVSAMISTFGGPEDVASGQDNGEFAFGGSSVSDGQESPENYAAIDPAWYKNGIKPGSTVNVINPNTGQEVPVILRDKGPGRWTGRGIDVAPHVLQQLGMNTDEKAIIDFQPAIMSPHQEQPKKDLTTAKGAQSYLAQKTAPGEPFTASTTGPSSGAQQDITTTSDQALGGVTKLPDGGYDLGGGIVGYQNGIFQARTGNSVTEYIPDPAQASGYKTHTFTVKSGDTSPRATAIKKAAEKGILRDDYPEGQEGDKQFNDELKLSLGAGVADDIAEAIMSGTQPPDTKGLYRTGPQVRAKLAQMGYDLKNANLDWQASQRFVLSQNSPPLVRLRQSAQTAYHSLEVIDDLAKQWQGGHFPPLNKARLVAAQQGVLGPGAASIARQLDGQITDLTFELGNVYMGGNTPTDQSLQLASKNLSADWDEKVLLDMTNLARRNLTIRLNSFKQVEPAGISDEASKESRWSKAHPEATVTPTPSAAPSYRIGQTVKLKNGQSVLIKNILPNRDIEY